MGTEALRGSWRSQNKVCLTGLYLLICISALQKEEVKHERELHCLFSVAPGAGLSLNENKMRKHLQEAKEIEAIDAW